MSCGQCQGIEIIFDKKNANKEYKHYLKKGAGKSTKILINALKELAGPIDSLIDIGGGIGAIQLAAAEQGAQKIINVDASSGYLEIAKKLSNKYGVRDKIEYHFGDVIDIGDSITPAEVVTLDKVFCCYDNIEGLVNSSSQLAKKYYGVVFPRDNWFSKTLFSIGNLFLSLGKNPYRAFIHSTKKIDQKLKMDGWHKSVLINRVFWQIAVYQKI
jgi:2-polyprenyl-3-methyl-5-hydroxy-6-metoxy-1,4-benzoquinol methylase